jgi:REP element-mobilizing transposase RayT
MSRPLRLEYSGAVWHVTSRGNERRDVFRDDGDRERFLAVLARTVELFGWRLHAYALMGNHYHLLLETPQPTLSRGMRQLNGIYTQSFNRRHRRTGHLFQGRFKAVLVEKDAHLLELCRYVVLNPVRARLVRAAKDWRWTSYRATAGLEKAPAWLETEWTLEHFGRRRAKAVPAYRRFIAEGVAGDYEPWKAVIGQIYLGSEGFRKEALRRTPAGRKGREVPRAQRRSAPPSKEALFARCLEALGRDAKSLKSMTRLLSGERKAVALILRRQGLLRLADIGVLLGAGEAQASRLVAGGETVLRENAGLNRRLECLTNDVGVE